MKKVLMAVVVTTVCGGSNLPKTKSFIESTEQAASNFMKRMSGNHESAEPGLAKRDSLKRSETEEKARKSNISSTVNLSDFISLKSERGGRSPPVKTQSATDVTSGASWSFKISRRGVQSVRVPNTHESEEAKRFSFKFGTKKKQQKSGDIYDTGTGVDNFGPDAAKNLVNVVMRKLCTALKKGQYKNIPPAYVDLQNQNIETNYTTKQQHLIKSCCMVNHQQLTARSGLCSSCFSCMRPSFTPEDVELAFECPFILILDNTSKIGTTNAEKSLDALWNTIVRKNSDTENLNSRYRAMEMIRCTHNEKGKAVADFWLANENKKDIKVINWVRKALREQELEDPSTPKSSKTTQVEFKHISKKTSWNAGQKKRRTDTDATTASDANESRMFATGSAARSSADQPYPAMSLMSMEDLLDTKLTNQRLEASLRQEDSCRTLEKIYYCQKSRLEKSKACTNRR